MFVKSSGDTVLEIPFYQNISYGGEAIAAVQASGATVRKDPLSEKRGCYLRY